MSAPIPLPPVGAVPHPDFAVILAALRLLFDPSDAVELRAFTKGRKQTTSGYFDAAHWQDLAQHAARLNASAAVYVTLNPVEPQLLARYHNRIESFASATTTDTQITRRRWLPFDLDAIRPRDTSATAEQHAAAHALAAQVKTGLGMFDWPAPIVGDSGNGTHLLYRIDLPNDDESRDLVKSVLAAVASVFDTAAVKVDQSVFNAGRIWKLYGTVANKGDHTPAAPWRLSRILEAPESLGVVTAEQMRALVEVLAPKPATAPTPTRGASFGLLAFLERLGIGYEQDQHNGAERFKLKHCPFNPDHGKGEAAIFQQPSGVLGFKCQHASCQDKHWQDVRELVDGPKHNRGPSMSPAEAFGGAGQAVPAASLEEVRQAVARLGEDAGAIFVPAIVESLKAIRQTDRAEWARIRGGVKATKAVRMSDFDMETWTPREGAGDDSMFPEDEPWPAPVDGAVLLTDIATAIGRYVIADKETIDAAALWAVFTWLLDAVQVAPIANITAPEKRCGKTVMLSVLGKLVYRPMQVADIATAALFRSIELWSPALLIDEVDAFLNDNEEARGIINAGFTRDSAFVIRCVGDDHTPTKFNIWGAKALCGIGKIADTLADRSLPLRLRRKKPGESAERLRHSDPTLWTALRQRIARWAADNAAAVGAARPALIEGLNDRANDCWEPLLAIAESAGGAWPHRAQHAAIALHGLEEEVPTIGAELLADIKDVLDRLGGAAIFGDTLLNELIRDEDRPWATWNRGTPMRRAQMTKKLGEYGIKPGQVRVGAATKKGFRREQFIEAWERYVAPAPPS